MLMMASTIKLLRDVSPLRRPRRTWVLACNAGADRPIILRASKLKAELAREADARNAYSPTGCARAYFIMPRDDYFSKYWPKGASE
jgi:hypothetical protein